jgi:ABC-type multidrug transport system fused ATPase/permease subunit
MTVAQGEEHISAWRVVRRLSRFALPHWWPIAATLLLLLAQAGVELLKPWPLKFILDGILQEETLEGRTLYLLIGTTALVVGIAVFEGLFSYRQTYFINRAARQIVLDLRSALFDHINRLSLQFHSRKRTGDLITRVTGDVKAINKVLTGSLVVVIYSILYLAGMAALLLWLDWQLALLTILTVPFLYLLLLRYMSQIRVLSRAERRHEGALASVLHETLGAVRLTRIFNQEDEARERFREESVGSLESGFKATLAGARLSWLIDVIRAVVVASILGFGVHRVMTGSMTPGDLIVFYAYVRSFYSPLRATMKHAARANRALARAERVVEVLDMKEGVSDLPGARSAPRFQGNVAFHGVTFEYDPGAPVLRDIDLEVPAGRVTAIVGPTGVGKTTLVSLIPRLYDPTAGGVLIDGEDIRTFTIRSLREQISMVLQESVLFRSSIAENIAYGRRSASSHDVVAAAKAANAHNFITALSGGYETVIGERGDTLSGGQRQRVAIARAIIRDAPILILDEPVVGLDAESAAEVLQTLERLMEGKTVILIAHDLSLVQRADRAVILGEGTVAQKGPVAELAEVEGPYRRLLEAQSKGVPRSHDVLAARQ